MRFSDLIIVRLCYLQNVNKQLAYRLLKGSSKNPGFLFNKLIVVKFNLSNFTAFATVICHHFGMTG